MREMNADEIAEVDGGSLAHDIGFAVGRSVGDAIRTGLEAMMNSAFRRQYA